MPDFPKRFLPAFIWSLIVLGLSAMPGSFLPSFRWSDLLSLDKLAHAFVYGWLTLLLLGGFRAGRGEEKATPAEIAAAIGWSCVWGAAMETMQGAFFPGRYFEILDMIANATGAVAGWICWQMAGMRRLIRRWIPAATDPA